MRGGLAEGLGIVAITSLGGAQTANKADWTPLDGFKTVCLLPDHDAPGEHYAQDVYAALSALESPPTVKVLRLHDLPEGGDVVDWLQHHARTGTATSLFQNQVSVGLNPN